MRLSDGRQLSWAEYGDPAGQPVVYFHGGNGSRLEAAWFDAAARELGILILAPDRPGFGQSDFDGSRSLLSTADDVTAMMDGLGVGSAGIFGLSGGGPHTLAMAHRAPERVKSVVVVSGVTPPVARGTTKGMWPPVRLIHWSARRIPPLNRLLLAQMAGFYADPDRMRSQMLSRLPEPDIRILEERPEILDIFAADAQEAHANGIEGDAYEWSLYTRDWGFALSDLIAHVELWYGRSDVQVPLAMGKYFARTLPSSTLHIVDDGAHFSTINNHIGEILTTLVSGT
jgi:pimeloyl-ACP methyl ester carboxylesterase